MVRMRMRIVRIVRMMVCTDIRDVDSSARANE